jgi:hypothetical protein
VTNVDAGFVFTGVDSLEVRGGMLTNALICRLHPNAHRVRPFGSSRLAINPEPQAVFQHPPSG